MCPWVGPHAPFFGRQLWGLPSSVQYLSPQGVLLPLVYGTTASALWLELRGHSAWVLLMLFGRMFLKKISPQIVSLFHRSAGVTRSPRPFAAANAVICCLCQPRLWAMTSQPHPAQTFDPTVL